MSDAYAAWRETKAHLDASIKANDPDDVTAYYVRTEEALRPAALLGFLRSFRGLGNDEEPLGCDEWVAKEFLRDLDELRAPTSVELSDMKAELMAACLKATSKMLRLNWTGDHTYADAIADVRTVLDKVFRGEPFPVLERFRCPSVCKDIGFGQTRCVLQLPHEVEHKGAIGHTWTDEQSINPPKSYDERPAFMPTEQQLDKLADEVFGNPDPINRPKAEDTDGEDTDGECGERRPGPPIGQERATCVRPKQHDGLHRDAAGMRWSR
jgi:hypothetical protein